MINSLVYVVFFVLFFANPNFADALNIETIKFGKHPDKIRMVMEFDQNPSWFKAFSLTDKNRLVIDLPKFEWTQKAKNFTKPAKAGIKTLRKGKIDSEVERIVVDLGNYTLIKDAFIIHRTTNRPARVVIDFEYVTKAGFMANKGKIFGRNYKKKINKVQKVTLLPQRQEIVVPYKKPAFVTKKPLIVIDPGHGGVDPGAVGANRILEKDITFKLAKELKAFLVKSGRYDVFLTRNRDVYIKLQERVGIARRRNADLFISIHADSIDKKHVNGLSIYTLSETASDKQTGRLAARENRSDLIAGVDLTEQGDDVASILIDLAMRDTMNQSKFMANTLVKAIKKYKIKTLDNPHRFAGFAVLKAPDTPSILIEAGFMSNYREAQKLNNYKYRRNLIEAISSGINNYFAIVRKNHKT